MFFATCSVARGTGAPRNSKCSTTADVSGEPAMRNALLKARRRTACCTHCGEGCSHAPRPGRLLRVSTITAKLPFPADTATTRSSSTASSRFRHPTHVRTGPPGCLCAKTEGSRWITAQSSVTTSLLRTTRTRTGGQHPVSGPPTRVSAPGSGLLHRGIGCRRPRTGTARPSRRRTRGIRRQPQPRRRRP